MKFYPNSTIAEVKDYFHNVLPYLKLEFYAASHDEKEGSLKDKLLLPGTELHVLNESTVIFEFVIDENETVAQFEHLLFEHFGWNAQVFRKSGEVWLQTMTTDSWSLKKQNQKGQQYTEQNAQEPIHITDFDLT